MRSNTWRAIMLLTLTLVLVSSAMDAQAARRSSLAGNQFINDPDDMFAFPQLTHQYKNRVIFDLGQDGDHSSGSVVFGDNLVWNFNTGRGMYQNTTSWAWGGTDRMPMGFENPDYEWWDVGLAFSLGETPVGFKINWQSDSSEFTPGGSTDPTTDNSTSMFGFQLGTTLGSVQLAAELGFGGFTNNIAPPAPLPSDADDFSMFLFTLLARGDLEDVGGIDWRWIAAFTSGSGDPKAEGIESYSTTGFRGSFGPVWGTPGEWEVAAYMSFEYMKDAMPAEDGDGDWLGDNKKDEETETIFPSYNMAMEYYLNSWFALRGGVTARSGSAEDKYADAATENPEVDKYRFYNIDWTLGLGVNKGNWGLDLALEEDNVHTGYVLFNGGQDYSGLDHPIALISAWLAW